MARVVHHQDSTVPSSCACFGERMANTSSIALLDGWRAVDLLFPGQRNGCSTVPGSACPSSGNKDAVRSHADVVVLATGGAGQVYAHTTNPAGPPGDGIAMALRARAAVQDMAFVQFHPTALYTGGLGQAFW